MIDDPHVQLMLRFQGGDEGAFRQLFEENKTALLNFIYRFCLDRRVAEELSQEVFLRVYKTARTYRPEAMFSTWLYRIATNICLNEMRSGKYKYERELKSLDGGDGGRFLEAIDAHTLVKTDEKIAQEERFQAVRKALRALPEKQRMALICSVYDQLSYKEIAERLGCSEAAVKSIIHRSKLALRDILKKGFHKK
ncbi:MAG: RNA polymerase sigma factor [Pseudomonadota bacterium]